MSDVDSTLNRSAFPDTISHRYPFITKAFPTYIWAPSRNNYVRACFGRPGTYLLHSMLWLLLGSVCLVAVTTLTLYHLLRTLQKEKRLSAIKNDFISNISHELKTPISTISGALEALEDFDVLDDRPKSQRYIRIARTESRRLSEMVGKILDLSLYERSDFTLRLAPVNIDELVRGLIEHYTLRKDKDIRFQYSSALPASIVRADELHLCNAINNLIDNAVKYSGSRVEIGIRYEQREGYHTISVTDNGMGIPKAEQSMVFDKFYRVPVSRAAVKGQGLGLSYVKAIVDRHRGWYSVESLGASAGSTFTLAIPIYD
jgi:two-component system, OmpR family, phosphate regulon sensor histidine kinase PhoR